MRPATLTLIQSGTAKKVDVLGIAGIQAAKKASDLVPLCHSLALIQVTIELVAEDAGTSSAADVNCTATVETTARPTGVEIEALAAVQIALLTVYNMCKAMDQGMVIREVRVTGEVWRQVGELYV